MRIVIVGAGIAGLSMALHLKRHLPTASLTLLESHKITDKAKDDAPSTFSGGLGVEVSPNGMRVLRRLSKSLHRSVVDIGYSVDRFEMRTEAGRPLGFRPAGSECPTVETTIMIGRFELWHLLFQEIEQQCGDKTVRDGCKLNEIKQRGDKAEVILRDGETLCADLVIGADGVRSVVRKAILEEGEKDDFVEFQ